MQILRKVSKDEVKKFLDNEMNLNDAQLYEQLNSSQFAVFQLGGSTASGMCKQIQPDCFDDVMALNALSRPGSSFALPDYVEAKRSKIQKYPNNINEFIKDSNGIIIYQEQIMKLVEYLTNGKASGNYARGLLKKLSKANAKQEDKDKWTELVKLMKEEAVKTGTPAKDVDAICNDMLTLSKYSFNKSHCLAYSYIAMQTVYLSRYFKSEYYAAALDYDASKTDKDVLKDSIKQVEHNKYKLLQPDINKSKIGFTPNGTELLFGLQTIKGIGEEPAKNIIENRPYSSIIEFITKTLNTKVNKRITTALVNSGSFDSIIGEENRKYYSDVVEKFYDKKKTTKTIPLLEEKWEDSLKEVNKTETTGEWLMQMEEQYLGGHFFHDKFSVIDDKIETLYKKGWCLRDFNEVRQKNLPKQYCFVYLTGWRIIQDKNGNDMAFTTIEDRNGEKFSVPIFASFYQYIKTKYFGDGFYLMDVYATEDGKIMFGSRNWVRDQKTIMNMMAKIPNV